MTRPIVSLIPSSTEIDYALGLAHVWQNRWKFWRKFFIPPCFISAIKGPAGKSWARNNPTT